MSSAESSFWRSVTVFTQRPNLINKRVMGSHVVYCWRVLSNIDEVLPLMKKSSLSELKNSLSDEPMITDFKLNQMQSIGGVILIVRRLLPKLSLKTLSTSEPNSTKDTELIEFILADIPNCSLVFVPKVADSQTIPDCCHKFYLNDRHEIQLEYLFESQSNFWINDRVLPKLRQWMAEDMKESGNQSAAKGSLQLIDVENYCLTYNRLKTKYGKQLIDLWNKYETTDPLKFVFEDIAIASYLIVLWDEFNAKHSLNRKQSFVDIGCGNGLLVYLLANEGYRGLGIDLRQRNIWSKYEPSVDLREVVFTPADESIVFEDYDWLIGNHSDELTVWIPYIAHRNPNRQHVFLLPCCPFDFDGSKYQRTSPNTSQYQCFVQYLQTVCQTFGFDVKTDKMRIPSTKRICLICESNQCSDPTVRHRTKQLVSNKLNNLSQYKPREKLELVRNCSRVSKDIVSAIVSIIADELIRGNTQLTIGSIPQLLTQDMRKELKSQCGGLQTLIRNHKHIFDVRNSFISFSRPKPVDSNESNTRVKTKNCWFFRSHPDGCPLNDTECRYIH